MRLSLPINELGDLIEHQGQYELVRELNAARVDAIRTLLRGQSAADLSAFDTTLSQFVVKGHALTNLIVRLRCPSQEGVAKTWSCEVSPSGFSEDALLDGGT